ncbi:heavy-metal-associated domain-containing protein [Pontibacter sp. MBLB2868]|uniref:heavy-metal-associated domain-containing protein n=1 Tax=Pontibacter sp. MBLB2868 TaxID=3451555 RepID=UPI003F7516FE
MQTLQFKTNINCAGCVSKAAPHLDAIKGLSGNWNVDVTTTNKVLTVQAEEPVVEQAVATLQDIGFKVEQL